MLATSPAPQYYYTFSKSVPGPRVALTAATPSARFLVTVRATALAPNQSPTTQHADAIVNGEVTQEAEVKFVTVRLASGDSGSDRELSVVTRFNLPEGLTFSGSCTTLSELDPCEASFSVELERADHGETGGSVSVALSFDFDARVEKQSPNEGPLDLPWDVEITAQ